MAYRRRHGISRSSTFKEELYRPHDDKTTSSAPSSPLGSQIRSSDAHRDSSLSSSAFNTALQRRSKELSETMQGGTIVDKRSQDIQETCKLHNKKPESTHEEIGTKNRPQLHPQLQSQLQSHLQSQPQIKLQPQSQPQSQLQLQSQQQSQSQAQPQSQSQPQPEAQSQDPGTPTNHEDQLKASRDVAIATAAKAKLLLREIKTVKADLAFAKQRSFQLEEENKILRDAREKGDYPADDDMIRLQLETLLAEKSRLAKENSVYVRENSCLREIIEYHKLSMQDVVYLDEGIEEVAEVNPRVSRTLSAPPFPSSPQNKNSFATNENPFEDGCNRAMLN